MKRLASIVAVSCLFATACSNDVAPVPLTQRTSFDSAAGRPADDPNGNSTSADSARRTMTLDTSRKAAPKDTTRTPTDTTKAPANPPVVPVIPPPAPVDTTVSPTGRIPRLVWTPQRQAMWAQMRREGHPLYHVLENNCNLAVAGSPRYGDRGLWCTIMYQVTGNVAYARTAWAIAQQYIEGPPASPNDVRENFTENAIMFDWLYPALSADEREAAVQGLNRWGDYALGINTPAYVGGVRLGDSDANIGFYFGLAATDLATAGLSPSHVAWLSATQTNGGTVSVGGLDATSPGYTTLRNTIAYYASVNAAGGEWFESSDYNMGTQVLLAMGSEAVRTATGADHFPEVTQYLQDAATAMPYFATPDLAQTVQWGDDEHPRGELGEEAWKYSTWLGTLAGVTSWNPAASGPSEALMQAVFNKMGTSGYGSAEPWARFFLFYNPYSTAGSWSLSGVGRYFGGTGHMYVHPDNSTLFEARMAAHSNADHDLGYLSDMQLYRNGEWVLTHPIGYGGSADQGQGVNSLLIGGLSAMFNRGPEGAQSGNAWWSITGSTSGSFYDPGYWNAPPAFLRMWRRTVVYLKRNGLDIIVVQDSVDADNPSLLGGVDRYRAGPDQSSVIGSANNLVQWIIHAPVAPAINGNVASWRTAGGQPVSVTTLYSGASTAVALPESAVLDMSSYQPFEVTGYQLRVTPVPPSPTGGQMVLRHVIVVGAEQAPDIHMTGSTVHVGATSITIGATVQVTN